MTLKKIIALLALIFTVFPQLAWASFAADSYEQKGRLENINNILLLKPRVIIGNREALGDELNPEGLSHLQVSKAVYLSSLSSFSKKGYRLKSVDNAEDKDVLRADPAKIKELWPHIIRFTDEGRQKKRKILPYKIEGLKQFLPENIQDVEAVVVLQIYGAFDQIATLEQEVGGTIYKNVLVNAVTIPLTGYAVIGTSRGKYEQFDYKISVFDVNTGELIWYREGVKSGTDFRSWSVLMGSLEDIYNHELPASKNPVVISKFKKKRSEIQGGNQES